MTSYWRINSEVSISECILLLFELSNSLILTEIVVWPLLIFIVCWFILSFLWVISLSLLTWQPGLNSTILLPHPFLSPLFTSLYHAYPCQLAIIQHLSFCNTDNIREYSRHFLWLTSLEALSKIFINTCWFL